jgi:hypothetical protein
MQLQRNGRLTVVQVDADANKRRRDACAIETRMKHALP